MTADYRRLAAAVYERLVVIKAKESRGPAPGSLLQGGESPLC
jgi:hypothetical protein